ncbi:hypothetical protein ACWD3I_25085 [Streptomyces sp. NPDC002817]|uniref:hypothetical protein n=1 Tax=Streptomyces sp. NPDC088357 TaxID=3154655 RepID=UPI003442917A
MNRSLTRNILRMARGVPTSEAPFAHLVEVEHVFSREAFADAPAPWSPGDDFAEVTGGAWLRDNGDRTQTAVVTDIGPRQLPAADGGKWTDEEVWTVTTADADVFAWLDDKPHRVTWALGRPDVTIEREPYAGHPHEAVADYWNRFYLRHWFTPESRADGRYGLTLACAPNDSWHSGPWRLADASSRLLKSLGGRASVRTVHVPGASDQRVPHSVSLMQFLSHL